MKVFACETRRILTGPNVTIIEGDDYRFSIWPAMSVLDFVSKTLTIRTGHRRVLKWYRFLSIFLSISLSSFSRSDRSRGSSSAMPNSSYAEMSPMPNGEGSNWFFRFFQAYSRESTFSICFAEVASVPIPFSSIRPISSDSVKRNGHDV